MSDRSPMATPKRCCGTDVVDMSQPEQKHRFARCWDRPFAGHSGSQAHDS